MNVKKVSGKTSDQCSNGKRQYVIMFNIVWVEYRPEIIIWAIWSLLQKDPCKMILNASIINITAPDPKLVYFSYWLGFALGLTTYFFLFISYRGSNFNSFTVIQSIHIISACEANGTFFSNPCRLVPHFSFHHIHHFVWIGRLWIYFIFRRLFHYRKTKKAIYLAFLTYQIKVHDCYKFIIMTPTSLSMILKRSFLFTHVCPFFTFESFSQKHCPVITE